jgi:hypothetical protein
LQNIELIFQGKSIQLGKNVNIPSLREHMNKIG